MIIFLLSIIMALGLWTLWTLAKREWRLFAIQVTVFSALIFCLSLIQKNNYPQPWTNLKLGEDRQTIHAQIGQPDVGELWDVKGDIWIMNSFFSWHRLDVHYDSSMKVEGLYLNFYIGTKKNYLRFNIRNADRKS